jgi:16S rRNA (uracil1498-N3)-methyltransferase
LPYAPIRFPAPLRVDERIRLNRVMVRALRFREVNPKEAFTLQDTAGRFFRASLLDAGPQAGEALVYEEMARSPESPVHVTLFCAVLARQRVMEVVRKATELGAVRFQPVLTERSVGAEGLEHEKAHAWPGAALRAVKQCRRASVPEVREAVPLAEALGSEAWTGADARYYLDDSATEGAPLAPGPQTICLASGPEGGWADDERRLLAESGGAPLVLGGRVLRAETAPIVALTLIQHRLGDLGSP